MKEEIFEKSGIVITAMANAMFMVKLDNSDVELICHISGKIRRNNIKILIGDKVTVAISPYDVTKGRITFREKK